jgi:hypothetical protein
VRVRGYDVWKKDYDESNETVLHSVEDWSLIGEGIGFQRLCAEFREHRVLWEGLRVGFDNATMLSLSFTFAATSLFILQIVFGTFTLYTQSGVQIAPESRSSMTSLLPSHTLARLERSHDSVLLSHESLPLSEAATESVFSAGLAALLSSHIYTTADPTTNQVNTKSPTHLTCKSHQTASYP